LATAAGRLPELATVPWRPVVDASSLRRQGRLWTFCMVCHVVPFLGIGAGLLMLNILAAPVAIVALLHAWIIPTLYALRWPNVVGRKPSERDPAQVAQGFLGDLLPHDARQLQLLHPAVRERPAAGDVPQAHVARDPVEPGPHVDLALVGDDRAVGRGEHLLQHVLGVLPRAQHVAAEGQEARAIALDERLEGGLVAYANELYQTLVAVEAP